MKKIVVISVMSLMGLYAGGKIVSPAMVPVVPVTQESVNPWYLGVGLVWADFWKDPCSPVDPTCTYEDITYGVMVRAGYDINQYFGIEGRYVYTFLDEGPYGGAPLMHAGIFLKPQYPLTERINIYALAGYGYTKNLGSGERLNYFDDEWGFSAGLGFEYDLSGRKSDFLEDTAYDREFDGYADQGRGWSFFVDYQRLLIKSDVPDMDIISIGIRYDF